MESREELEKRVADLERQLGALPAGGAFPFRGIRKRASWNIGGIPFYDIAIGPDMGRGEFRGHAKGIIALGDMATGVVALGGLARGVFAFGGLAIGSLAFGGGALGGVAIGGGAVGYYACGGGAAGVHVQSPLRRDPRAAEFFREYGLTRVCAPR